MEQVVKTLSVSERKVCKLIDLNRTAYRYEFKRDNSALKKLVYELSIEHPRYGYRKIYQMIKDLSTAVSKETIRAIRKQEGLQIVKKQRKKRAFPSSIKLRKAEHINHVWSWDFMFDVTADGRKIKIVNIIDEYSRECLASFAARSITARDIFRILQKLIAERGLPSYIRSDNGPEFVAKFIKTNFEKLKINTIYIEPGSPWQNAYVESFNSVVRDYVLNRWMFYSIKEAQVHLNNFKQEYNEIRPHGSLDGLTPASFASTTTQQKLCA